MNRPPRSPSENILGMEVGILLLLQSLSMCTLCILCTKLLRIISLCLTSLALKISEAYFFEPDGTRYSESHSQTLCFVLLTTVQLFHGYQELLRSYISLISFLSRSKKESLFRLNPLSNYWMIGAVLLSFTLLVSSVYLPGVQDFLELTPLMYFPFFVLSFLLCSGLDWGCVAAALVIHVIMVEILKAVYRTFF